MATIPIADRWLYRVDGSDYGPVSTEDLMKAMENRQVDLSTKVCPLTTMVWEPASSFGLLRDHFERCEAKWAAAELHREADSHARRLSRTRSAHSGLWKLGLVGVIVALGVLSWLVWRLVQAEPIGIAKLVRIEGVRALPEVPAPAVDAPLPPLITPIAVKRLGEPETYDTSGVRVGDALPAAPSVTKMSFNEDGTANVDGIGKADLQRVVAKAKAGLYECAKAAARADRSFSGTTIGFSVRSGRIGGISLGSEARGKPAFQACVKRALRKVSVPTFTGAERRVSVPLKISW